MTKDTGTQEIQLETAAGDLTFTVTREAYVSFVNAAGKKTHQAMQNFLAATVDDEARELLTNVTQNPATVPDIFGAVYEQYAPDLAIRVKKPKTSPAK